MRRTGGGPDDHDVHDKTIRLMSKLQHLERLMYENVYDMSDRSLSIIKRIHDLERSNKRLWTVVWTLEGFMLMTGIYAYYF
jgi:hypothetical protein